jgi:predicted metal-dependent hydrolase
MVTGRPFSTSPTTYGPARWGNLLCVAKEADDIEFQIELDGIQVPVRRKRVRNLNLRVTRDGQVELSIPYGCPRSQAEAFVRSHQGWVERSLSKAAARRQAADEARYVTGGETFLWGMRRTVRVEPTAARRSATRLDSWTLTLCVPFDHLGLDEDAVAYRRAMVVRMRKRELLRALPGVVTRCERRVGVTCDEWRVRQMSTRWGTCQTATGIICLNTELAAHPMECLEYVVCHELCHLIVPNHGPAFYAELARSFPEWERIRYRLMQTPPLP